jgi:hypothetical protein
MPWARLDDGFHDHPKVSGLLGEPEGWAAIGFWTLCLTWAHRHTRQPGKHPGFIPAAQVIRMDRAAGLVLAQLLVKHGLWEPADGGFVIHDFARYLPPPVEPEVRASRRRSGSYGAHQRWHDGSYETCPRCADGKTDGKVMRNARTDDACADDAQIGGAQIAVQPSSDGKIAMMRWQNDGTCPGSNSREVVPVPNPTRPDPKTLAHRAGSEIQQPTLEGIVLPAANGRRPASPAGFDEFWTIYPRKVGKKAAQKAWIKAIRDEPDIMAIIAAARRYAADPRRAADPEFTAHPATWLNAGRYDDEPDVPPRGTRTASELNVGFWGAARGK